MTNIRWPKGKTIAWALALSLGVGFLAWAAWRDYKVNAQQKARFALLSWIANDCPPEPKKPDCPAAPASAPVGFGRGVCGNPPSYPDIASAWQISNAKLYLQGKAEKPQISCPALRHWYDHFS